MRRLVSAFVLALLASHTPAQQPDTDKSRYSLFDPTPRDLWRPMSADRPDFTESPYTVDAGAFQLEMSFVDYTKNGSAETLSVAPANLKIGLLNNVDVQFVFVPFTDTDDGADSHSGFGDTQIRLKVNLWGNDGGDTAFGIMPYVKFPTASDGIGNDEFEGGLIVPFAVDLSETIGLGLMGEIDAVYDDDGGGYDFEFVGSGVLGVDVTDRVGLYIEGVGIASTDSNVDFRGLLGLGATYTATPNVILDAGVNIGLTGDVDDFNIFTGISWRF